MTAGAYLLILMAGVGAGMMNAAVGSGTLLTYPILVSLGIPPVVANGTNSLGLVPGSIAGAFAYRKQLVGRRKELVRWGMATSGGAVIGALLVVALPARVFTFLVPWLILLACTSIALQPVITKIFVARKPHAAIGPAVFGVGIYGGYFGAGQGVAYLAALGSLDVGDVHRANAVKNVISSAANTAAGLTFALAGFVELRPAIVLAIGSLAGGLVGGNAARRLPPVALRVVVVLIGLVAAVVSFLAV